MTKFLGVRRSLAIGLTAAMLSTMTFGAIAASADEPDQFDPLAVVQAQNVLSKDASPDDSAPPAGAVDTTPDITPLVKGRTDADPDSGALVTEVKSDDYGFVTGTSASGTPASFVAIADADAPSAYKFAIGDASSVVLQKLDSGKVVVADQSGKVLNVVLEPWAIDAAGKHLSTYYTVSGNELTQHVDLTGATYPVVADPQFGCGVPWCSIYFNKKETAALANGGIVALGGAAAACGAAGPAGIVACSLAAAAIGTAAVEANRTHKCAGLFFAGVPPLVTWNPFIYTGKQCK